MIDLHYASILEVSNAIKARKISAVELTKAMLDRIAKLDPQLRAFATLTQDLALAQAYRVDKELSQGEDRGPLHGVPIAVKDICYTAGVITAAGTTVLADHVPEFNSTVVDRLTNAGAVLLGKLQLTEGAFVTHHPAVTPPRNPWNALYYPGASSSGSGVATASGLCFGSIGSDTGGSIRFPSSANGVTGLKPTWGRVSRYGIFALADSLDHIGPLTRSAADAGAMLGAIAGLDPHDPTTLAAPVPDYIAGLTEGVKGMRIGVDASYNEDGADPEIVAMMRAARAVFEKLGAVVREMTMPNPDAVIAAWAPYCAVETAIAHNATYPARASEYGPLKGHIDLGRSIGGIELMKGHQARLAFSGALARLFCDADVLLIPTQPRANFTLAQEIELFKDPKGLASFLRFTTPFNMSGSPTITLPGGFTKKGMPVAFQLVARHLEEELLVRAGHTYQEATDWHRRHPTL